MIDFSDFTGEEITESIEYGPVDIIGEDIKAKRLRAANTVMDECGIDGNDRTKVMRLFHDSSHGRRLSKKEMKDICMGYLFS